MTTALLFGGQGNQKPGMLHDWATLPAVAERVEVASDVLGEDAWNFDSQDSLRGTRTVQLSLLILQTGIAQELADAGLRPDYGAGHSLGAWSAAVAAGALDFSDAVHLVDVRGSGMAAAAPSGYGMSAVIGLSESVLARLTDHLRQEGEEIWLSNLNSAHQSTVSGAVTALERLGDLAQEAGAQRVVRLDVAVPAHSPMMTPARQALGETMGNVEMVRPQFPLLANTTGRMIRTTRQLSEDLIDATDRPVRWSLGVAALSERGIARWVQVSPGNNLISLLRDVKGSSQAWCVDNVGIEETVARIRK